MLLTQQQFDIRFTAVVQESALNARTPRSILTDTPERRATMWILFSAIQDRLNEDGAPASKLTLSTEMTDRYGYIWTESKINFWLSRLVEYGFVEQDRDRHFVPVDDRPRVGEGAEHFPYGVVEIDKEPGFGDLAFSDFDEACAAAAQAGAPAAVYSWALDDQGLMAEIEAFFYWGTLWFAQEVTDDIRAVG